MSDKLLFKLVNNEIAVEPLKKWLLSQEHNSEYNCSQSDFLTYFLNFIHEKISSLNKSVDSPLKCTLLNPKPRDSTERKRISIVGESTPFQFQSNIRSLERSFTEDIDLNMSTPKNVKDSNKNYSSPISPLYESQHQFSTPGNKSQAFAQKSPLCLGDFITAKRPSSKKKNIDRNSRDKRITPTCLTTVLNKASANSFGNFATEEVENRSEKCDILSELLLRKNAGGAKNVSQGLETEPELLLVSCRAAIDKISDIYITILKNNLVLNITSEIYFLISLLLSKRCNFKSCDDTFAGIDFLSHKSEQSDAIFSGSIHNIVYFSVKCLESQLEVLKHYDKSTLKLLSENKRLQSFSSSFAEQLGRISSSKPDRIIPSDTFNWQTNVCFDLDTDNRDNFPNDVSFHAFRKQRDLFYEILRVWETNHVLPSWNFSLGIGSKIKALFTMQGDSTNFMHFSRLFKAQLLRTCCEKSQREEGFSEPFLSSLPNIDANKLNLLKTRLVTKQVSGGLNSLPSFTGHQEFYRDFIVAAANHTFNKHLCDTFVAEIVELNDTKFGCTDMNESDAEVDASIIEAFSLTVRQLRVLAKFLGLLESLPYKSESSVFSEKLLNSLIQLRRQTLPSFDVKQLLTMSLAENTVVLTVPWVVVYLSMLDYVTLRLPYYTTVCKVLFGLYRCYHDNQMSSGKNTFNYNIALVEFSLGWLFELPHFPDGEYFNFRTIQDCHYKRKSHTLDGCNIVDQNLLYVCCPYLEEVKKLLTNNSIHCAPTVRHITPVTARDSSEVLLKKRTEQLLEEAFFNGQPASVKKTVEFVSERIASACVKHICYSIVPAFRKSALQELKSHLEIWLKDDQVLSPAKEMSHKLALKAKASEIAQTNSSALLEQCHKEITAVLSEKLPAALDSLLALDALAQTKSSCASIAARICKERLKQWLNTHVNLSVFTKDFDSEVQKALNQDKTRYCGAVKDKPVFALPSSGSREHHNDDSLSAFHLLERIKNLSVDMLDNRGGVEEQVVKKLLNEARVALTERCDVNESIAAYICMSLVDFSLLIVIRGACAVTEDLIELFKPCWGCYRGSTDDLFKNLLCPRNIKLLASSGRGRACWDSYAAFVTLLIQQNVVSCDSFECQCMALFRNNWDRVMLEDICYFLERFVDLYKMRGGNNASRFTFLLDFFSDYCSDL